MAYDATDFQPATVDPLTITEPKERLKYLADFLRGLPAERFNIRYCFSVNGEWLPSYARDESFNMHACGSAACVTGWAQHIWGDEGLFLGLSSRQAAALFMPPGYEDPANAALYTATRAADVLDHLRLTGEVDWSVASSPVSAS